MEIKENALKQNREFIGGNFKRAVIPGMLTVLSANINVFVDGLLVGNKMGIEALAAINMALPFHLFLYVVGSFISSGTAINAAKAMGQGNNKDSLKFFRTGAVAALAASVVITVMGLLFLNPFTDFLCPDPSVRPFALEYLTISIIGSFSRVLIYIPLWYLRLDGYNVSVMIMMGVMSIGNVILDFIFVYLNGMGVYGAGLASVYATSLALMIGIVFLCQKKCSFRLLPLPDKKEQESLFISKKDIQSVIHAGTPSSLNNLLPTIRMVIINSMFLNFGGVGLVAVFTAVNGIFGFAECITLGIPQAGQAMMGVYSGEKDNSSMSILFKIELIIGLICGAVFMVIVMPLSGLIREAYRLNDPVAFPLLFMCLSIFPGLICNLLSSFYNMSGRNSWANGIIILKGLVFTWIGLLAAPVLNLSLFSFYIISEVGTLIVWYAATLIFRKKDPSCDGLLLLDNTLEKSGMILSFSVDGNDSEICSACERISDFCSENGLLPKQQMALQLAMEEIMIFITEINQKKGTRERISFDLRAYAVRGVIGIRLRYNGIDINPFNLKHDYEGVTIMGVEMIKKLVEMVVYQRSFGTNTLQVLLN